MTGGKGAHGGRQFIRHLLMKQALGIPSSHRMWPARQMRGRDHRCGTWWSLKQNCIAIKRVDFAQDTQEEGADEFELILDSDEEGGAKGSSLLDDDDEYVPETEPQNVMVSRITGPCANQGRQSLSAMLPEWKQSISDMENESVKVDMERAKVEESAKVEMEKDTLLLREWKRIVSDMENGSVKVGMERAKVQMGTVKLEKESAKVEMEKDTLLLREWKRIVSDMENGSVKVGMERAKVQMVIVKLESAKVGMERTKVQMDTVKLENESDKVEMESDNFVMSGKVPMDSVKLEKQSVKMEMDSIKVEINTGKEEVDHISSFSDIETDDESSWFQDGVDLRGHSQVEDDDFNEQGLLIVFVIGVGQLLFIIYDVDIVCVHAKVMYDIIQGYLVVLMGHLNQMHGWHCHLVQKQADHYKNALPPTHILFFFQWII